MAEEANRNKNLAESALHRLKIVSELGKKLTYSLDVQDIIKTVYRRLVKGIPLTKFVIMIKNSELNRLESIAYYAGGKQKDNITLMIVKDLQSRENSRQIYFAARYYFCLSALRMKFSEYAVFNIRSRISINRKMWNS